MAALILVQEEYNGQSILERGVKMRACRKVYVFKPYDVVNVDNEIATRVIMNQAGKAMLRLERYDARKHRNLLSRVVGMKPVDELDPTNPAEREILQRKTFDQKTVNAMGLDGVASLAVHLGIFTDKDQAKALPLNTLKQVCLVKLGYKSDDESPTFAPEDLPKLAKKAVIRMVEKTPVKFMKILARAGLVEPEETVDSFGGKEDLLDFALAAYGYSNEDEKTSKKGKKE